MGNFARALTELDDGNRSCDTYVLVAGHISLDIIPDLSNMTSGFREFMPGNLVDVGSIRFSTGGCVLNTGLALNRLGVRVRLLGRVGNDEAAQTLENMVQRELTTWPSGKPCGNRGSLPGSDLLFLKTTGTPTCCVVVLNPRNTDRMFLHCPGANTEFSVEDITDDVLRGANILHLGYPPLLRRLYEDDGKPAASLLARAQSMGIVTSLDMAMPDEGGESGRVDWIRFCTTVLPYVDIFMPSIEEAMFMVQRSRYEELRRADGDFVHQVTIDDVCRLGDLFLDMGAKIVGLKLGDQGLYVRTAGWSRILSDGNRFQKTPPWWQSAFRDMSWGGRELFAPCFEVKVAGTTGSGDCTIAGFLAGLLKGLDIEDAMLTAVGVGACNVEASDALSGVLPWQDVLARIQNGWPQVTPQLHLEGWERRKGIYHGPRDLSASGVALEGHDRG